jgi:TolB-like protein/Flp pilus assembly protein TadD
VSTSRGAIFLSYASQDAEAAHRISEALRVLGLEVWFDQSELRGGDAWDASIRRQIKECALFVPVISANTQARDEGYFRLEWKLAVDRSHLMADDQAFLLPVVIDATLDANARVPEKFREVQWTRLSEGVTPVGFAERVQQLVLGGATPSRAAMSTRAVATAAHAVAALGHEPPSIAVLPFVNRSHDPEDEYFSDGLADELLNVLTKIRGLRVAARSSAFTFKGKNATVAEIGRALNVATVLEGSVRKAGNRMRISVQLVKVTEGYHLWSEIYDRTLEDIFAVQDDIAQSVVKELRSTLLGETADAKAATEATAQVAAAVKGRATDAEAHRLYLQGRHFVNRFAREDIAKGIEYLKQALDRDPEFALAWVSLSAAYAEEAGQSWVPLAAGLARAREAAARALALQPKLAEAHAATGWIRMNYDWDWRGAEASFGRALELAPGNAAGLRQAAGLAFRLGRLDEAIGLWGRAIKQDPLNASAYHSLGITLDAADRLTEAEQAYAKALELAPHRHGAHAFLGLNLLAQGRGDEALDEALLEPESWRFYALAIIHHAAGRRAEADAALNELIAKHAEDAAFQIGVVYAARAKMDLAFQWLERAYVQRDPGLSDLKSISLLRPLHGDPRWAALLRKMGLAE